MHKDHPRLRGDHRIPRVDFNQCRGSPPLTRGPPENVTPSPRGRRITPAYAGTTDNIHAIIRRFKDHPRLRGDHHANALDVDADPGSPPLTRGPRCVIGVFTLYVRITPAYAGTTSMSYTGVMFGTDHPRLRGDHLIAQNSFARYWGSPPLTRGPLVSDYVPFGSLRITPAYAGTTSVLRTPISPTRDHPRLRGDHRTYAKSARPRLGSPPLTRGPPNSISSIVTFPRITPAYAGTTTCG